MKEEDIEIDVEQENNLPVEAEEEVAISPQTDDMEESASQPEKKGVFKQIWGITKKFLALLNPKTIIFGKIISLDFIIHYWKVLLTLFFVLLFYISNRYSCQQSIANITKMRRDVEEIGYKSLDMFTRLKTLQREDSIVKKIKQFGLDLQHPEQPPYIIEEEANGEE